MLGNKHNNVFGMNTQPWPAPLNLHPPLGFIEENCVAKLSRLINGQDIKFDTHQAGDGQTVNWKAVHLEKRMHNRKGKIRIPLLGNGNPSSRRMSRDDFERIMREVRNELDSNQALIKKLAETIVDILGKFSSGQSTSEDAKQAAKKVAGYFDLDDEFESVLERYARGKLVSYTSVHMNPETGLLQEISQSKDCVVIRKARKYARIS